MTDLLEYAAELLAQQNKVQCYNCGRLISLIPPQRLRLCRHNQHNGRRCHASGRELVELVTPNGPGGVWVGSAPLRPGDPRPPYRQAVVYTLRDQSGDDCYLGSTAAFPSRLWVHMRRGVPAATWVAIPCPSRRDAYMLEQQLLDKLVVLPTWNISRRA